MYSMAFGTTDNLPKRHFKVEATITNSSIYSNPSKLFLKGIYLSPSIDIMISLASKSISTSILCNFSLSNETYLNQGKLSKTQLLNPFITTEKN